MAYKALVNKYHPDRNPNCEKSLRAIQAINASYEVLSDPDRRRQHDRWIAEQDEKYKKADQHNSDKFPSHNTSRSQPVRPTYPTPPPQASPPKDTKSNRGGCGCLAVLAIGIFILIVSLSSQSTSSSSKSRSYVSTTPTPTYTPQHTPTPLPFDRPAVTPPKNGELVVKANYTLIAPFEIRSHAGDDYLVKLTDAITGQDAMTVFVKGGQTVNTAPRRFEWVICLKRAACGGR